MLVSSISFTDLLNCEWVPTQVLFFTNVGVLSAMAVFESRVRPLPWLFWTLSDPAPAPQVVVFLPECGLIERCGCAGSHLTTNSKIRNTCRKQQAYVFIAGRGVLPKRGRAERGRAVPDPVPASVCVAVAAAARPARLHVGVPGGTRPCPRFTSRQVGPLCWACSTRCPTWQSTLDKQAETCSPKFA